jgi:hypothetical protein
MIDLLEKASASSHADYRYFSPFPALEETLPSPQSQGSVLPSEWSTPPLASPACSSFPASTPLCRSINDPMP